MVSHSRNSITMKFGPLNLVELVTLKNRLFKVGFFQFLNIMPNRGVNRQCSLKIIRLLILLLVN